MITALSASATLILGAILGALPALLAGSWSDAQTRFQTWVLIGFTGASLAAAATAIALHRKRRWVLHQNGTAYVVQELASDWARQDEKIFLESAGRYFARVVKVPGPGQLGRPWDWPLDSGARYWDDKLDELARAFQTLRFADGQETPDGILMWASWAVAAAFGMRVTAADRDLVLDVWHRPSNGRAGRVETVIGTQRPHRFGPAGPVPQGGLPSAPAPRVVRRPAELKSTRLSQDAHRAAGGDVTVLLLRLGHQAWGPLPGVGEVTAHPVRLEIIDAAGVCPDWSPRAVVYEWRCLPPPGGLFPWMPSRRSSRPRPTGSNANPPSSPTTRCCSAPLCRQRRQSGHNRLSPAEQPSRFTVPRAGTTDSGCFPSRPRRGIRPGRCSGHRERRGPAG
jgi:hypothetical protein